MTPSAMFENGWFDDRQGPFLYQDVTGDFLVIARVTVGIAQDPNTPPSGNFNVGGLLARSPAGGDEWVLIDVGRQGETTPVVVDIGFNAKTTTTAGGSVKTPLASQSATALLAICRIGTSYHMIKRATEDAQATILMSYSRPDLPATLQVGTMAGSYLSPHDGVAHFPFVHFVTGVASAQGCLNAVDAITFP